MKYINRAMEKTLKESIGTFPVIMITGPRQVGKSTLLNYLASTSGENINRVSLDSPLLKKQATEDPELFLRTYGHPLIIDEFQYAPELLNYIKIRVDEARENALFKNGEEVGTMYYLTGSQVFETMKNVSESLAGRVSILDLYGLSTREIEGLEEEMFVPDIEILKKKEPTKRLSTIKIFERILNGSYPDAVNTNGSSREAFFEAYIRTYIERDVRYLTTIKDENKFIKFISSMAARTGCEFNESDIARDVEIDNKTANEWMSILKNTHLIYLLQSYSNNNVQKAIKRPKIYFMDTGLACYLTGYMDAITLEKSAYNGAIFETYIITEIIKSYANAGKYVKRNLYYYRDKTGKEIDLLIFNNNKVYPVEIKKSANPKVEAIKNFDVVKNFGTDIGNGTVLCMTREIIPIDRNNYYVPIEYI